MIIITPTKNRHAEARRERRNVGTNQTDCIQLVPLFLFFFSAPPLSPRLRVSRLCWLNAEALENEPERDGNELGLAEPDLSLFVGRGADPRLDEAFCGA